MDFGLEGEVRFGPGALGATLSLRGSKAKEMTYINFMILISEAYEV